MMLGSLVQGNNFTMLQEKLEHVCALNVEGMRQVLSLRAKCFSSLLGPCPTVTFIVIKEK